MRLSIYNLIGKCYEHIWWTNCHCRNRCLKGARNTKKSVDFMAYEIIDKILSTTQRNVLVIRNTAKTNKSSTFARLKKYIYMPDPLNNPRATLSHLFKFNNNELMITRIATGQVIMFAGMDDPQKIASMEVVNGFLTDVYVEEAFEIKSYDDWRVVDGTIRGELPDGLFHQITFCFNAWNKEHWLYHHFFEGRLEDDEHELESKGYQEYINPDEFIDYGKGLALHTSSFRVNEFRARDYDEAMAQLKERSYDIYRVEALGCWGNATESTYPEWNDGLIIPMQQALKERYAFCTIGIDFGISDGQGRLLKGDSAQIGSATTMQLCGLTQDCSKLVCLDEYFYSNETQKEKKTAPQLQQEMVSKIREWRDGVYRTHPDLLKGRVLVYVDCADSGGFRQGLELEARRQGLMDVLFQPSTKISIQNRVDFIRLLMAWGEFQATPNCKNLIREIKNARRSDKGTVREDTNDHAINANEYAWAVLRDRLRRWKTFKVH